MLCPKCKREKGDEVKMKCIDSRACGSFGQNRIYECKECGEKVYTTEKMV